MIKNIVSLFIFQGVNYLVPIMLTPYLTRVLGVESYGELNFALGIIAYGAMIIDFGFNLTTSAQIARHRDNISKVSIIYSTAIFSKLLLASGVISALYLLSAYQPDINKIKFVLLLASIQLLGTILNPLCLLQGLERLAIYSFLGVASKLICFPLTFIFVKDSDDVGVAALLQAGTFFLTGLISIPIIYTLKIRLSFVSINLIIKSIKDSAKVFTGTLAISLYTMATPTLLGVLSSSNEVALFSSANKIRMALTGLFMLMGNVFYPRVNFLFSRNEKDAFSFLKKIIIFTIFSAILLCSIGWLSAPYVIIKYLGSDFYGAILLFKLMLPMVFLVPLSIILSNYILLPLGYHDEFARTPIITSLIHIMYIVPAIFFYGALGASVAILVTEVISFTLLFYIASKKGLVKRVLSA